MSVRTSPASRLRAMLLCAMLLSGAATAQGTAPATSSDAAPAPPAPVATAADDKTPATEQAKPGDQAAQPIQLNGVTVQGKRNPLDDTDKHLKQLQDSLPCNGCDAKPPTHKKLVNRVLNAVGDRVLPTEAPDHSTRDANDKAAEFSQQNTCTAANVGGCLPDNAKP